MNDAGYSVLYFALEIEIILSSNGWRITSSTFYEEWRDYFNSAALATEEELRRVMDDEPEKS